MELLSQSQGTYTGHKPGSTEQIRAISAELWRLYPDAKCSLNFSNPLELLIATQLSAQCTDERVNSVTRDLFQKYRSVEEYVTVSQQVLEQDIRSTGFYPIPRLKAPVLEPWGWKARSFLERGTGAL